MLSTTCLLSSEPCLPLHRPPINQVVHDTGAAVLPGKEKIEAQREHYEGAEHCALIRSSAHLLLQTMKIAFIGELQMAWKRPLRPHVVLPK